ncbi:hypothetical protein HDU98_001913 [Podochytrium sp. JEL0797]|nr:hypothetical protein HDU98_001913 [Podochytrium sp. JEL0797]
MNVIAQAFWIPSRSDEVFVRPKDSIQIIHEFNDEGIAGKIASLMKSKETRSQHASNCGSLKIMVAGDTGIGKTSFLESFMTSPHFTFYEPLPSQETSTPTIASTNASTIPQGLQHPGESPTNITFIDTPGLGSLMDAMMVIRPVVDFVTSQFPATARLFSPTISTTQLTSLVASGTGIHTHVDVCFYCILHRLKPVDLEYMRLLSSCVTLVPVILKGDTMTAEEVFDLKRNVIHHVSRAEIAIYGFGLSEKELVEAARDGVAGAVPFVVSAKGFGSCLNEMEVLRRGVLENHVQELRWLGAERFVAWRRRQ